MTTDYRALCAEAIELWDADCDMDGVIEEMRALLSQPQPPAGEVGELVEFLHNEACNQAVVIERTDVSEKLTRAADLLEQLAQPAVEPTDAELLASLRHLYANQTAADMGAADDLRTARAVLASLRWLAPQPIPVSERLPEAGDCISRGGDLWCWGQERSLITGNAAFNWRLMRISALPDEAVNWLPAHALPLPSGEVK